MKLPAGKPIRNWARLETRTKECTCTASPTEGVLGAERRLGAAPELCACDPIDSELCLGWAKPGETLVEALSRSDVQFDGRTRA